MEQAEIEKILEGYGFTLEYFGDPGEFHAIKQIGQSGQSLIAYVNRDHLDLDLHHGIGDAMTVICAGYWISNAMSLKMMLSNSKFSSEAITGRSTYLRKLDIDQAIALTQKGKE